ncbi:DUF6252 family protein [Winogradskyella undariae]|uniref:DUF6252 family protein n=2 Tax=Winogradskyella TaxID=286104 RepID=UPI0015CCF694|nr:DUF6252 family protein [Winogradskyella undariae]
MMKKLILLSLVFFTAFSCGDEVKFNTPAFQGDRENALWRAKAFSASVEANGYLTITGTSNYETVELIVPSVIESEFNVGEIDVVEAKYTDGFGTEFSTTNTPDESVSVYPELGKIIIEEIDVVNKTFTGTYRFLAFDASGMNSVGFTNGIFYKVPLISGTLPTDPITCTDVEMSVQTAFLAYEAASVEDDLGFINSDVFAAACNAYSEALTLQFAICGDPDGTLQELIESLEFIESFGDCEISCEMAMENVVEAELQYSTATIGNYIEKCTQYAFYLQQQIDICGDNDGSLQLLIDGLDCSDNDVDGVPNVFENFNGDTDGNLDDDDTDGDGIPNYLDDDDDGDGVLTIFEAKDADGNPIDTDGDGDFDYLDADDDGDLILTINESSDPNGDGNPDDAVDTDNDGIPDYLQA